MAAQRIGKSVATCAKNCVSQLFAGKQFCALFVVNFCERETLSESGVIQYVYYECAGAVGHLGVQYSVSCEGLRLQFL